jgi:O-succinylbenzoic acid--CoA ligase
MSQTLSVIEAAAEQPDQPALIRDGSALTFGELAARVLGRMRWLEAQGVMRGNEDSPAALVASADEQFVEFLFALFEMGVPALLVHPRWTDHERSTLLRDLALSGSFAAPWPTLPADSGNVPARAPPLDDERALAILYTSGSSGAPKGVVLSRRAFLASARASEANLGWQADDRWLLGLPPAHIGGLSVLTRCLLARRAVVLTQPKRHAAGVDPRSLADVIERERVTLLSLVPTQLARLLELEPPWNPPAHVRAILLGGAAAPPPLIARARERGFPILTTYGLTEACSQVTTQRLETPRLGADAGQALPGIEVSATSGQILVRGPVLFTRYFPSGSPAPLRDGWFQTGDSGIVDADGVLHVIGRDSEMIITGGENVWPAEVEHALLGCSDVRAACVFALPDPTWGEVLGAALVVADPNEFELQRLSEELRARLASFKRPRQIALLPALPLTPSGKPDRSETRRVAETRLRRL